MFHIPPHKATTNPPGQQTLGEVTLSDYVRKVQLADKPVAQEKPAPTPTVEAVLIADAYTNNVGLPTYSELARALRRIQSPLITLRLQALLVDAEVEDMFKRAGVQL
jgi:hypothetical protein